MSKSISKQLKICPKSIQYKSKSLPAIYHAHDAQPLLKQNAYSQSANSNNKAFIS